jgi:uncharacterized protein
MKALLRVVRILALAYLGLIVLLAGCQNHMLYHPSRASEAALAREANALGLQPWKNAKGEIVGWRMSKPNAKRRVVAFHGNAGYALHRAYYADGLGGLDWEVYLFEYPGYGARDGTPSKEAFLTASRAAVDELLAADPRPVFLLGESIGSGVACALAADLPGQIKGLILVTPFARLIEVAKWHFPYLPVGLLLRDKFDNVAALEKYRGPAGMVIADCDEVVSPEQGRKLHAAYTGPKLLITLPGCGHNNFPTGHSANWWREVTDFLDQHR